MIKKKIFAILCILFTCYCTFAQQKISATLIDKDTKQPVEFAAVATKPNSSTGVMSDDKGQFSIKIQNNTDSLYIMHMSYLYKAVAVKDIKKQIKLTPLQSNLDTVNVYGLGARALIEQALKKIKQNYHLADFFVDMDMYMLKKKNKTSEVLAYERSIWKPYSLPLLTVFVPVEFLTEYTNVDSVWNKMNFNIDDIVMYYNIVIIYNRLYKSMIMGGNYDFTMKIITKDSVETGYIITQKGKRGDKYIDVNNSSLDREVKYYIDATDFSIQKIEARLLNPQTAAMGKKEQKKRIHSWVTTVKFLKYQDKYYLSNCFSRVKYSFAGKEKDIYEEKTMFNARACRLSSEEYKIPQQKRIVKPIDYWEKSEFFRSFLK